MARKRVLTRQQQHDVRTPRIGIGIGIGIGSSRNKTVDRDDDDDDEPSSWFASSDGSTTTRIRSRCSVSNRRGLPFSFPSRCCFWCSANTNANTNTNANATNNGTPSMSMSMLQRRPRRHRATDGFGSATATLSATRIVGGAAIVVFVSLVLPKWIFAAGRNLLMSRPAVLYGTPTDWNDVAGCLSRTHRREVRDHYRAVNGGKNDNNNNNNNNNNGGNRENLSARIPLNPNVRWNWSRYSSSSLGDDGDSDSASNKKKKKKKGKKNHNHQDDTTSMMPRRRLLIAQYSGKGSYERLLREVEPINRAYARKWGHDYTTLIGTALKFPGLLYDPPPQPPLLGETDRGATANERNNGKNKTGTIERRHGEKRKRQQQQQQRCRYFHSPKNGTDSQSQSQSQSSYYEYEAQSTFNKIPLLFKAMDESPRRYDQVLILDADTMIVDFDYDITTLLLSSNPTGNGDDNDSDSDNDSDNDNDANIKSRTNHDRDETNDDASAPYFLAAYRVWQFDWISTWDVNAGITLWDLHHPSTRAVAEDWLRLSLGDPKQVLLKNDDQYYLQRSLQRVKKQKRRRDQKHQQRRRQQQQQRRDNAAPLGSGTETTNGVRSLLVLGTKTFRNWWKKHTILPAILGFLYDSRRALPQTKAKTKTTTSDDKAYNEYEYDDGVGILAIRDEFDYYDATVVKHFKRDTASWSRTGLEQRVLRIREAKAELCQKWPGECTAEGLS